LVIVGQVLLDGVLNDHPSQHASLLLLARIPQAPVSETTTARGKIRQPGDIIGRGEVVIAWKNKVGSQAQMVKRMIGRYRWHTPAETTTRSRARNATHAFKRMGKQESDE
jgi:hypothetical protein